MFSLASVGQLLTWGKVSWRFGKGVNWILCCPLKRAVWGAGRVGGPVDSQPLANS